MRRIPKMILLAVVFAVLWPAVGPAAPVPTQGDYALALAQVLGFEVSTAAQAAQALTRAEIAPTGGWRIAEPLTPEVLEQVERALGLARSAGTITAVGAQGALDAAAAAVGVSITPGRPAGSAEPPAASLPTIPVRPPVGDPGDGGGPDGSPFRP